MKLVLAIVNNDDSAIVSAELTREGYMITKLSTTGGFLQVGNTTLLIGAQDDQVEHIKEIIRRESFTRKKNLPTSASYGKGIAPCDCAAETNVTGATVFVLDVNSFEKL